MLTDFQTQVLRFIGTEALDITLRDQIDQDRHRLRRVAGYAYALYCDLVSRGHMLEFSEKMIRNRRRTPLDPMFFFHTHAIHDLVEMISNLEWKAALRTETVDSCQADGSGELPLSLQGLIFEEDYADERRLLRHPSLRNAGANSVP